ncbi:hypothetical protein OG413_27955 [Streptomyces sp. NBC_01433]|nr:hypothetical protein [Streptomyces sp. NBC_01433]MCX4679093.1 hypothetical protein [Streptomyces sp. NBC_01433]
MPHAPVHGGQGSLALGQGRTIRPGSSASGPSPGQGADGCRPDRFDII